jgi:hypothetical protein
MEMSGQLHAQAALPPRKEPHPRYTLDKGMGGPQSLYGRGGDDKKFPAPPGIFPGRPARILDTILTELARL